jgi:hypothetical protein
MNHDPKSMSCHEFQDQLAELIGSGANVDNHPHLQTCELCRALLNDLETIAKAARDLLNVPEPQDDLWIRIDEQIKKEESGLSEAE